MKWKDVEHKKENPGHENTQYDSLFVFVFVCSSLRHVFCLCVCVANSGRWSKLPMVNSEAEWKPLWVIFTLDKCLKLRKPAWRRYAIAMAAKYIKIHYRTKLSVQQRHCKIKDGHVKRSFFDGIIQMWKGWCLHNKWLSHNSLNFFFFRTFMALFWKGLELSTIVDLFCWILKRWLS